MKKFAALFLALIMALSMTAALAEGADTIDLSGKTAEELIALIDQARNALAELKDVADLEDVTGKLSYFDEDDWNWDFEGTSVTWTFAK